jgi:hypothetical protein
MMKKLYILAAGLFSILAFACTKDKSTSGDRPMPTFTVSGLQASYAILTHKDTLRIRPTVQDESRYEYYWTAFDANYTIGKGNRKPDTLGKTKDLDYAMMLNPGPYILVFNLKDKETGVTKLFNANMTVSTLNMNGWYLLKDNNGKTDFDFFHSLGRIDNWIAFYNDGKSLEGAAIKAVFTNTFKMSLTSQDIFAAFAVLTGTDAAIYRIDNGKVMRTFDDMFFTKPANRRLQSVFQPSATTNLGLVNDGQAYVMQKGTLFTSLPYTPAKLSSVTAVGAMDLAFDEASKSLVIINSFNFQAVPASAAELKNMNADLVWLNSYAGLRGIAMALFRKPDGSGLLYRLNVQYGYLLGSQSPMIQAKVIVPATHSLMAANAIGGNYDADFVYYAVGNKVYMTDLITLQEALQITLPAGETVTGIQHIKYPQPSAGVPVTTDYLSIATFANGRYKVYLHKISSTGTIQPLAQANFEGEGRINTVIYMENGNGSRVY